MTNKTFAGNYTMFHANIQREIIPMQFDIKPENIEKVLMSLFPVYEDPNDETKDLVHKGFERLSIDRKPTKDGQRWMFHLTGKDFRFIACNAGDEDECQNWNNILISHDAVMRPERTAQVKKAIAHMKNVLYREGLKLKV